MPNWKKVVTSGSNAELNHITASGNIKVIGDITADDVTAGKVLTDEIDNQSGNISLNVQEGGNINFQKESVTGLQFQIQESNTNLTSPVHFKIATTAAKDITFDSEGKVELNSDTGDIQFKDASATLGGVNNSGIFSNNHITASGDISSSGNIILGNNKKLTFDNNLSGMYIDSPSNNQFDISVGNTSKVTVTGAVFQTSGVKNTLGGNTLVSGHITASGNISASGTIQSTGNITSDGNVTSNGNFITSGFLAFGSTGIRLQEQPTGTAELGGGNKIKLSHNTEVEGHITASGNISASGEVYADGGGGNGGFFLNNTNAVSSTGTILNIGNNNDWTQVQYGRQDSDAHRFIGNITSSGHISSSGTLFGSIVNLQGKQSLTISSDKLSVGKDTYDTTYASPNHDFQGHITASGNISSSATSVLSIGEVQIVSGTLDLKNAGAQSQIKMYCDTNNAHFQTILAAPHSDAASNTLTLPSVGSVFATTDGAQTLTNKTLTAPTINGVVSGNITASGNISGSSTSTGSFGHLMVGGSNIKTFISSSAAADGFGSGGGGGGSMDDVVDDTTPQLGGDLDLNSKDITGTGNIGITGNITASGDISASQSVITNELTASSFQFVGSGTAELEVEGNITASGIISASGNLIGNQLVIGGGTFTSASLAAGGGGSSFTFEGDQFATDLKVGRDSDNHIDFTTDNQIDFDIDGERSVSLVKTSDSGSIYLSGSLEFSPNELKPATSSSRIYNYKNDYMGDRLEFNGVPFGGTHYEQIHSNFIDDLNTGKVYMPIRDVFEQSIAYDDNIYRLATCSGSLVSLAFRLGNVGTSGGTLSFTLEKAAPSVLTSFTTVATETFVVGSGDRDYHTCFVRFDADATVAPGEIYAVAVQADADIGGNTYYSANMVWAWDYTSLPAHGTEIG